MSESPNHTVSVYHLYTNTARWLIVLSGGFLALLTPFTDTVYLPALKEVKDDLNTTDSMVAFTISVYLACVGVGQLFWGPLSDRYGRQPVLLTILIVYLAITIACIFSVSIEMFLALRSVQGFVVGATVIVAQAIVADVFPAYERGEAMGKLMAPMLFGPVIAPLIGGAIAEAAGWRATFILLAALTGPMLLAALLFLPETHHYLVKQRVHRVDTPSTSFKKEEREKERGKESGAYAAVDAEEQEEEITVEVVTEHGRVLDKYDPQEALRVQALLAEHAHDFSSLRMTLVEAPLIARPEMQMPWTALLVLADPLCAPFILTTAVAFGIMFSTLTLAPLYLAEAPYDLSPTAVGVTFLAFGGGSVLGAALGGLASDASSRRFPQSAQGRLVDTTALLPLVVVGGMLFAYACQCQWSMAVILVMEFVLGLTHSWLITCCMAYLGEVSPKNAAAAGAVLMGLCFSLAAITVSTAVPAAEKISLAGFFWVLDGVYAACCVWWAATVYVEYRRAGSKETTRSQCVAQSESENERERAVTLSGEIAIVNV